MQAGVPMLTFIACSLAFADNTHTALSETGEDRGGRHVKNCEPLRFVSALATLNHGKSLWLQSRSSFWGPAWWLAHAWNTFTRI